MLSLPFRVTPAEGRLQASRVIAAVVDSLNAVLAATLACSLGAGAVTAAAAGLLYAVNPVMAGLCALSASEPLGITFILMFLLCSVPSPRPPKQCKHASGQASPGGRGSKALRLPLPPWGERIEVRGAICGFLIGCAALVRMNWLLIAPIFAGAVLYAERSNLKHAFTVAAAVCAVTLVVVSPWAVRNRMVFDKGFVLGGGGGETLLGGNNDLSADIGGKYWGYIVQPGGIPGEKPLHELAATMDEVDVNRHYVKRALAWLRANPGKVPGLLVGKLFRAYVPWPRSRAPAVLVGTAYRWGMYVLAACGVVLCVRHKVRIDATAAAALVAVVLAHVAVTLAFCGVFRYVIASEILLCLPAAVVPGTLWRQVSRTGRLGCTSGCTSKGGGSAGEG